MSNNETSLSDENLDQRRWPTAGLTLTAIPERGFAAWTITADGGSPQRLEGPMFSDFYVSYRHENGVCYILGDVEIGDVLLPVDIAAEVANIVDPLIQYSAASERMRRAVALHRYVTSLTPLPDSADLEGQARLQNFGWTIDHIRLAAQLDRTAALDIYSLCDAVDAVL